MSIAFAIPGDLSAATGGYAYAREVMACEAKLRHVTLPGGFPSPSAADITHTVETLRATPGPLVIDGLAYGAFPAEMAAEFGPRAVALVHHPLCLETGVSPADAVRLEHTERAALHAAAAVIATSDTTTALLRTRFAVPAAKLTVAEPGLKRRDAARR